MPTWTSSPPTDPRGQGLPLVRTPANRPLRAIVTSDRLIGTDTHFWGGHTVPCERPDCEACNAGIGYRWHGYLSAYNPSDQLHFVFEITAQAAVPFADYLKTHGTLRCAQFDAYRWQRRKNGRVIVKVELSATPSHAIPHAPDLRKVMAIIWRLPIPNVDPGPIISGRPTLCVSSDGNGQDSDPRLYETPNP